MREYERIQENLVGLITVRANQRESEPSCIEFDRNLNNTRRIRKNVREVKKV